MTGLPLRLAAVLTAALTLTACSGKDTPSSQAPSVTTTVGPSDSPTAAPSASSASPTPGSSKTGGSSFTFPTTAKGYAQALLSAWGTKSSSRLELLANQATVQQIKDNGYPNADWTYIDCTASGETSECVFRNAHGDEVLITLTNTQIGHPTAATQALLERTTYASSAESYVSAFMYAWQHKNVQRMARLATSSVADKLKSQTALDSYSAHTSGDQVIVSPTLGGTQYTFTIVSGNLGKAHAISAVSTA
ncbi:MAG: hypothetical protein HOU81_03985 [Hamadaea sp.]|uniref:hypothetical protein n=1 Tax=Hamadaea sp. TaxID=2024425 RepID=UPI0018584A63|nr:hypothetical protein [Hamadaea sp.]NUR69959.1 hypothetical protein [Hamadaea sp.]NUT20659.1 hypothetical protein [Hamadaea sp.]